MRFLAFRALVAAALATALGCATPYKPPTFAQPHATFKLRRVYQSSAGTHLHEKLTIDEHVALAERVTRDAVAAPLTNALLAHPTPAELLFTARFVHTEMRMVQEAYYVQVPYTTTESYSCGGASYQMCTRSVTHYRSETRYRTVLRPVEVIDGSCSTGLWVAPARDRSYILEYDYSDNGVCRMSCFEQTAGAEPGTFENRACQPPSAEQVRKAHDSR